MAHNSSKIKGYIFQSEAKEMSKADWQAIDDEMESYEEAKSSAARQLAAQFPDTPAATWKAAINSAVSGGRPVQFTSNEKKAAFDVALKNL